MISYSNLSVLNIYTSFTGAIELIPLVRETIIHPSYSIRNICRHKRYLFILNLLLLVNIICVLNKIYELLFSHRKHLFLALIPCVLSTSLWSQSEFIWFLQFSHEIHIHHTLQLIIDHKQAYHKPGISFITFF